MKLFSGKIFVVLVAGCVALAAGCTGAPPHNISGTNSDAAPSRTSYITPLQIGQQQLLVEVVDTDTTRQHGLSGREQLENNQGMLFDFRSMGTTQPSFWMKEMKFDLDLIWIRDGTVIGITPNVPAPTSTTEQLPTYAPPSEIDMVLEVNAGWAARHGIKVGDRVQLSMN